AASGATKDMVLSVAPTASPESNAQSSTDYSQTNVQVQGVDEADLVKNDGKYVYIVKNEYGTSIRYNPFSSGSTGKVKIIDAYPAASMKQVGEISIDGDVQQIFVNGDKRVVFGSVYVPYYFPSGLSSDAVCLRCVVPPYYSSNFAFMRIYDISDKASPKLLKRIEVKGNYVESRMIGSKVYTVFSDYASYDYPMPLYRVDGQEMKIAPTDVGYFDFPDSGYSFNILSGVDLSDLASADSRKVVLMGGAQNLFVSSDNLYVTYSRYDYYDPMWRVYNEVLSPYFDDGMKKRVSEIDAMNISGWRKERLKSQEAISFMQGKIFNPLDWSIDTNLREEIQQKIYDGQQKTTEQPRNSENTAIHKFALDSAFTYGGQAEVPGHALNQFSMDEYNGTFRIATTVGQSWNANPPSSNGIYVFDSSLKQIGKLEGLAKGESIYSARFMGARAYLVTFKKTDPLFVIGLSDPTNPEVLGKLKIPGYSDYLHPYDETHLIGLGKGAVADENGGNFAWYQGVKLSLFDVSDVEHPKEVAYYEIGDRGTDSYALSEHKAFLFSKEKNLLVIPITLAKIDPLKYPSGVPANTYGDYVFQGAYVFSITPEKGFALRGTISHVDEAEYKKSGDYWWSNNNVVRSLYIGEYLYTLSDLYLKANDLGTLVPVSSVQVGQNQTYRGGYYYE
ncbi:MAG: beta-propeller domain-containing protein, partial [Candidatus Micrarchaeota archaeon]|nr:beta-propeller domain-containing protein [Candidatus Micrarchaeota archaeon]